MRLATAHGGFGIISKEVNPDTNNTTGQLRTQYDGFYSWNIIPGSYFEGEGNDVIYKYYIGEDDIPVCIVNTRKK
jgi:hypothetical protein